MEALATFKIHQQDSMMKHLAFTWSHNDPYLRGSIVAYPFNWLEASYQYTDVNNALYSSIESFSGSQSYKDKSFDFKVRFIKKENICLL